LEGIIVAEHNQESSVVAVNLCVVCFWTLDPGLLRAWASIMRYLQLWNAWFIISGKSLFIYIRIRLRLNYNWMWIVCSCFRSWFMAVIRKRWGLIFRVLFFICDDIKTFLLYICSWRRYNSELLVNIVKSLKIALKISKILIPEKDWNIIIISLLLTPLLRHSSGFNHLPYGLHIRRTGHNSPRGPNAGGYYL
jgi:hypothetical protein